MGGDIGYRVAGWFGSSVGGAFQQLSRRVARWRPLSLGLMKTIIDSGRGEWERSGEWRMGFGNRIDGNRSGTTGSGTGSGGLGDGP